MTTHQPLDGLVHQYLIKGMIESARCPPTDELSKGLDVPLPEIKSALQRLESNHGLVLHPHECSVWMIHPFAVSPSNTWVHKQRKGWWAPCMWCALGVTVLVGGEVTIHARIGGEAEAVEIPVRDGYPEPVEIYAHFALPPRRRSTRNAVRQVSAKSGRFSVILADTKNVVKCRAHPVYIGSIQP